ncbi:MAG: methyltransferase [Lentisphaerae bacterium]|nr:methyltransferase [Lentisphaerota bacterium]
MHTSSRFVSLLASAIQSRRRLAIPLAAAPGMQLLKLPADDVHRSGQLQFECIRTLAMQTGAEVLVTFMDLSVEAEAFGCAIRHSDTGNPEIVGTIAPERLATPAVGAARTGEALRCAELCAKQLTQPVLGGLIGPFSLACLLTGMSEMMMMAAVEPDQAHAILRIAADFLCQYLLALRQTGLAGAIIAEPSAGLLSPEMCRDFSVHYLRQIIAPAKSDGFAVILHNCGKTEKQVPVLLSSGADALHVGNAVDIRQILAQAPPGFPILGNLDPVGELCDGAEDTVRAAVRDLLQTTVAYPNHIVSSGCDIPAQTPIANIKAFFAAVQDYNQENQP